jgi:glycosyltransferase involved in cell wall biosynthesis
MAAITVAQALQTARVFQQTGQVAPAEALYRQILAAVPDCEEARQALGMMPRPPARAGFAGEARRHLYYAGTPEEGFGWGVANKYLVRELSRLLDVVGPWSLPASVRSFEAGPVFMVLADHDFHPLSAVRGTSNFGYTFFEDALGPKAAANAARYETVFCGSTWCLERMRERGIRNGKVLVQGVDHEIFHPATTGRDGSGDELRVFSGGKFEFRKGQDLVIAAFREFVKTHPRAKLVCAWHNFWPATMRSMAVSPHILLPPGSFDDQREFCRALLMANGIPKGNFEILPLLSQSQLADAMRSTDLGVFPNRCEGGTNLVLMEYLACGRPAVATGSTGHADVLTPDNALVVRSRLNARFWEEPDPVELAAKMTRLAKDSLLRATLGARAVESMKPWTWERAARLIVETIYP